MSSKKNNKSFCDDYDYEEDTLPDVSFNINDSNHKNKDCQANHQNLMVCF
jgi:hypothetical protein